MNFHENNAHRAHHIVMLSVESNANTDKSVYSAYIHQNEAKQLQKPVFSTTFAMPTERKIFISTILVLVTLQQISSIIHLIFNWLKKKLHGMSTGFTSVINDQ